MFYVWSFTNGSIRNIFSGDKKLSRTIINHTISLPMTLHGYHVYLGSVYTCHIYVLCIIFFSSTVEEPCDLGCEGLNYCTVFNNRPTELFRSCSPQTDDAAHYDVTLWRRQGTINLFDYELPLKNITKCMPHNWKAVACILQIRPCTREAHVNKICRQVFIAQYCCAELD